MQKAALSRRDAWAIALTASLAMSISYVDRQTLSVLAPTVTAELGISDAAYGWLGAAFSIAYLASGPFAGALVDRLGARRSLPAAIVIWSTVAALHAIAPGFAILFALRLALGVTESPTFPAGVQIVQRALPLADRARGMSSLFVGISIGSMIAPPLAIALATRFHWRVAFVGTACVAALWVPAWMLVTRSRAARSALDDAGARTKRRLREAALHPAMLRGLVGLLAVAPASAFMMAWEAKYYARQFALAQKDLAGYLVASAVVYDLGALVFGDLAIRRADRDAPARALVGVGAACASIGMVTVAFAPSPRVALVGFVLGAVGRGALVTLVNSDALARVPQSMVAAAGGVIASVQSLGAIVVNPLLGLAVQRSGYTAPALALAAWTIPGCAAWILWKPPPRADVAARVTSRTS